MRVAKAIVLLPSERRQLTSWALDRSDRPRSRRSKIVLLAAQGLSNKAVAAQLGLKPDTAGEWRLRFLKRRLAALVPTKRKRRRRLRRAKIDQIVRRIGEAHAPDGSPWTLRTLATETGVSPGTVGRIWRKHHVMANLFTE